MKVLFYSAMDYDRPYFLIANKHGHELTFVEKALGTETAALANGHDVAVIFAGDECSTPVVEKLHAAGVKHIAIRAVGYDNVDIVKARKLGISVANVPEYSPYAIAEHAISLMLALDRKTVLASAQVKQHNFSVGALIGFDLHLKTVGIVGTGRTGSIVAKILHGFGCKLLACDINENQELIEKYDLKYVSIQELCRSSEVITLHVPLNAATKYLINKKLFGIMNPGVMLINTARGGVVNTADAIAALDNGTIGYLGLDVYEKEKGVFFYDLSGKQFDDEILLNLLSRPNVMVTPHQAFATKEALVNIAATTFYNINCWSAGNPSDNDLTGSILIKL